MDTKYNEVVDTSNKCNIKNIILKFVFPYIQELLKANISRIQEYNIKTNLQLNIVKSF